MMAREEIIIYMCVYVYMYIVCLPQYIFGLVWSVRYGRHGILEEETVRPWS